MSEHRFTFDVHVNDRQLEAHYAAGYDSLGLDPSEWDYEQLREALGLGVASDPSISNYEAVLSPEEERERNLAEIRARHAREDAAMAQTPDDREEFGRGLGEVEGV